MPSSSKPKPRWMRRDLDEAFMRSDEEGAGDVDSRDTTDHDQGARTATRRTTKNELRASRPRRRCAAAEGSSDSDLDHDAVEGNNRLPAGGAKMMLDEQKEEVLSLEEQAEDPEDADEHEDGGGQEGNHVVIDEGGRGNKNLPRTSCCPRLVMFEFKQNDRKADTGMKITRHGLAQAIPPGTPFQGIVLSGEAQTLISPADRPQILRCGLAGINCSWNRLEEVKAQRLGKFPKNHRILPLLLAANTVNYGKPMKLSTAEAIAACLKIAAGGRRGNKSEVVGRDGFLSDDEGVDSCVTGEEDFDAAEDEKACEQMEMLAEQILEKFKWGPHFWELNKVAFEFYCDVEGGAAAMRQAEQSFMELYTREARGGAGKKFDYGDCIDGLIEEDSEDEEEDDEEELKEEAFSRHSINAPAVVPVPRGQELQTFSSLTSNVSSACDKKLSAREQLKAMRTGRAGASTSKTAAFSPDVKDKHQLSHRSSSPASAAVAASRPAPASLMTSSAGALSSTVASTSRLKGQENKKPSSSCSATLPVVVEEEDFSSPLPSSTITAPSSCWPAEPPKDLKKTLLSLKKYVPELKSLSGNALAKVKKADYVRIWEEFVVANAGLAEDKDAFGTICGGAATTAETAGTGAGKKKK